MSRRGIWIRPYISVVHKYPTQVKSIHFMSQLTMAIDTLSSVTL